MIMARNSPGWTVLAPCTVFVFALACFYGTPNNLSIFQQGVSTRRASTPYVGVSSLRVRTILNGTDETDETNSDVTDLTTSAEIEDNRQVYYTNARHDRSGQHLLCFINLDAVAFADGAKMGGQCLHYDPEENPARKQHLEDAKELIKFLGFENDFHYVCPTKEDRKSGKAHEWKNKQMRPPSRFFTPEWYADFQKRIKFQYDETPRDKPRVAIHIRRGDVSPCNQWDWHYLDNSYYLNLVDEYLPKYCGEDIGAGCNVTIYSESASAEPFDVFEERGFHLALSGPLEQVWGDMINADVAVVSISSFSYVPAVLNRNTVIYPPHMTYDMDIMPGWIQVPESYWDAAELRKTELKRTICGKS